VSASPCERQYDQGFWWSGVDLQTPKPGSYLTVISAVSSFSGSRSCKSRFDGVNRDNSEHLKTKKSFNLRVGRL
jgi:hypothetical protein